MPKAFVEHFNEIRFQAFEQDSVATTRIDPYTAEITAYGVALDMAPRMLLDALHLCTAP
jgi:hypothetical protein